MPGAAFSAASTFSAVSLNCGSDAFSVRLRITSRSLNCDWFFEKTVSMSCLTRSDCEPGTSNPPWDRLLENVFTNGSAATSPMIQAARIHRRRRYAKDPTL